jgi:hypothetical protein
MSTKPQVPTELPQFIRDQLAAPPSRGEGLHLWIFRIARQLHWHRTEGEIIQLLQGVLLDSGVKPGEIESAVRNSKESAWRPGRPKAFIAGKRWPDVAYDVLEKVTNTGVGVADLVEASPMSVDIASKDTEDFVDILFPGNPLLCCGSANTQVETKQREAWRGSMAQLQFIVPSPMSRPTGLTKEGNTSARCLDNTGPRRYLVVEFDRIMPDKQAAVLLHLADRAPLAMVVSSGNKSLHGWFYTNGCNVVALDSFFTYAVQLGADPATFTPCQLVRMPGGRRDNGKIQQVLYLAPEVIT